MRFKRGMAWWAVAVVAGCSAPGTAEERCQAIALAQFERARECGWLDDATGTTNWQLESTDYCCIQAFCPRDMDPLSKQEWDLCLQAISELACDDPYTSQTPPPGACAPALL